MAFYSSTSKRLLMNGSTLSVMETPKPTDHHAKSSTFNPCSVTTSWTNTINCFSSENKAVSSMICQTRCSLHWLCNHTQSTVARTSTSRRRGATSLRAKSYSIAWSGTSIEFWDWLNYFLNWLDDLSSYLLIEFCFNFLRWEPRNSNWPTPTLFPTTWMLCYFIVNCDFLLR